MPDEPHDPEPEPGNPSASDEADDAAPAEPAEPADDAPVTPAPEPAEAETPDEPTAPASPFEDLLPPLRTAVEGRGFTELTSVQRAVLEAAAEGRNLRISSQTGSGKTIALAIAIAQDLIDAAASDAKASKDSRRKGPRAMIVTPTRELAQQFARELHWLYAEINPLHVAVVTGGTDIGGERRVLARRPLVLVGTPGRTLDHIRAGALKLSEVHHVVLDEADQMLDMGFKDELDAIVEALPEERHSYLVSATFPRDVRRFANKFAPDSVAVEGTRLGVANADIEHVVYVVRERDRYAALVNNLLLMHGARVLVFVQRRADAADLAEKLAGDGFSALPFSGDLSQAQRNRTLNAFRRGVVQILVATDVAARGIDVADIRMVVHGDVPRDPQSYTHRSGRTGRAGHSGRSIVLATHRNERRIRRLLQDAKVEAHFAPIPTAKKIKKSVTKRARRAVHAAMVEPTSDEGSRSYAAELLTRYEPAVLVAELLRLAEGDLPHAPMELTAERPGDRRDDRDDRPQRGDRDRDRDGGSKKRRDSVYTPFQINWGGAAGATPARLLAHICRRGDVDRHAVGAMQVNDEESRFEIEVSLADEFAKAAARPDPRDPHLVIERTTGPVRGGKRSGGPRPDRKDRSDRSDRGPFRHPKRSDRDDRHPGTHKGAKPRRRGPTGRNK